MQRKEHKYSSMCTQSLTFAVLFAFTTFFPGLIGKVLTFNIFGKPMLFYKETLATIVSMFVSLASEDFD